MRVVSIDKRESIINLWTEEPKLNSNNILFEGVILNPGFRGAGGIVLRITFEAKKSGKVLLNFNEGAVLANDGLGTNVLATLPSVSFKIIPTPIQTNEKSIIKEKEPLVQNIKLPESSVLLSANDNERIKNVIMILIAVLVLILLVLLGVIIYFIKKSKQKRL